MKKIDVIYPTNHYLYTIPFHHVHLQKCTFIVFLYTCLLCLFILPTHLDCSITFLPTKVQKNSTMAFFYHQPHFRGWLTTILKFSYFRKLGNWCYLTSGRVVYRADHVGLKVSLPFLSIAEWPGTELNKSKGDSGRSHINQVQASFIYFLLNTKKTT
jgi:hypothetical protein